MSCEGNPSLLTMMAKIGLSIIMYIKMCVLLYERRYKIRYGSQFIDIIYEGYTYIYL